MSTSEIFLIAMTIILTAPYLVWRLGRTEYYAPLVVVQIVGGILLEAHAWRAQWFETGEKKIRDQAANPDSHELQTWIRLSKFDA